VLVFDVLFGPRPTLQHFMAIVPNIKALFVRVKQGVNDLAPCYVIVSWDLIANSIEDIKERRVVIGQTRVSQNEVYSPLFSQ
jgi:hypothetical protein